MIHAKKVTLVIRWISDGIHGPYSYENLCQLQQTLNTFASRLSYLDFAKFIASKL